MYVMLRSMIILWSQVLSHKGLSREWNFSTHLGMRVCEIRGTLFGACHGCECTLFQHGCVYRSVWNRVVYTAMVVVVCAHKGVYISLCSTVFCSVVVGN